MVLSVAAVRATSVTVDCGAATARDILLDSMLRMEMRMMQKVRINQHQPALISINQQSISGTGWMGLKVSEHTSAMNI